MCQRFGRVARKWLVARGWKPAQGRLQPGFASVLLVSNSSWRAEAEVSLGRCTFMDWKCSTYHASLAENSQSCSSLKHGLDACYGFFGDSQAFRGAEVSKVPHLFLLSLRCITSPECDQSLLCMLHSCMFFQYSSSGQGVNKIKGNAEVKVETGY